MQLGLRQLLMLAFSFGLTSNAAFAGSWQDKLSSTANDLMNSSSSAGANQASGPSLQTLTSLLNSNSQSLASGNIKNAVGVLDYCSKNKVVGNDSQSLIGQLKNKLGLSNNAASTQQNSYLEGAKGLLTMANNKQLDLKSLSNTQLGQQLKTKACNIVLEQGKRYLAH